MTNHSHDIFKDQNEPPISHIKHFRRRETKYLCTRNKKAETKPKIRGPRVLFRLIPSSVTHRVPLSGKRFEFQFGTICRFVAAKSSVKIQVRQPRKRLHPSTPFVDLFFDSFRAWAICAIRCRFYFNLFCAVLLFRRDLFGDSFRMSLFINSFTFRASMKCVRLCKSSCGETFACNVYLLFFLFFSM